ncbi:IclR family transcriptional regulator [Oricola indica]|uniref:IclR family transcriptional regulator n=1 Tax=Oricola indica TaxID=2872591 RepID=UPI003CCBB1DB
MALTSKSGTPAYAIESVDSAFTILRMLCDEKEIRLSDVAKRLGVAQSTAHRLLSMLVHHGFARQDEKRGGYKIGPTFVEMGFAAIRDLDIREHARPILEELRDSLNETIHLGVPYGREILYVEGVESLQQLRSGTRAGSFVPAHCVSLGKAVLATLSPEELRHLYPEHELPAVTNRTVTTFAELERQLARIRRAGYAKSRAESTEGVGSIAVAIVDHHGVGRGAVSVSAPLTRMTRENEALWIEAAKETAEKLRDRLWSAAR